MNLTSKSRYALKIMMDLAHYQGLPLIRRSDISKRQGIPPDYMDQIMIRLRVAKLVESVRGRSGGYRLARAPEEISLWDVFSSVEDSIYPVECVGTTPACDFETSCVSRSAWSEIFTAIRNPLENLTLGAIVSRWTAEHQISPVGGIRECRAGASRHQQQQQSAALDPSLARSQSTSGVTHVFNR